MKSVQLFLFVSLFVVSAQAADKQVKNDQQAVKVAAKIVKTTESKVTEAPKEKVVEKPFASERGSINHYVSALEFDIEAEGFQSSFAFDNSFGSCGGTK
jgi:hypothetical protein